MKKDDRKKEISKTPEKEVNEAIRMFCRTDFGVLNKGFLCQPVSVLNPKNPFCLRESSSIKEVGLVLKNNKIGCVLLVSEAGNLNGIFSERDFLLKVAFSGLDLDQAAVSAVMTADPVSIKMEDSIAFALNLMSNGGFRHLPVIDTENRPVGIISVKDVMDYIVEDFTKDLLNFEISP